MNYDAFETLGRDLDDNPLLRPSIPSSVYQPVKRCPNCQSVYLTDTKCEACGRSLLYHPIGEPFSAKSLYGFKERHYASFPLLVRYYPVFEDKQNDSAKSYVRNLMKRFDDLLEAFGVAEAITPKNRRFFYVEILELTDELLRYGVNALVLQHKIEAKIENTGPLLTTELLNYLSESKLQNKLDPHWKQLFFSHRLWGVRVDFWMKLSVITTTIIIMAVSCYELISLQVGK